MQIILYDVSLGFKMGGHEICWVTQSISPFTQDSNRPDLGSAARKYAKLVILRGRYQSVDKDGRVFFEIHA